MSSSPDDPIVSYTQAYVPELIARVRAYQRGAGELVPLAGTFRKTARILAMQMAVPFVVHTDRGPMRGYSGDWLVTNHPEDDASSDLWCVDALRFAHTYEIVETLGSVAGEPVPYVEAWQRPMPRSLASLLEGYGYRDIVDEVLAGLRRDQAAGGREPSDRHRSLAITALEDALFRLDAMVG